ncbi:MAG: hypothetical protein K1060chlam2_00331 [Chlamydiae bacterium]|nr:hypothetical protein [Chlamydiota bacterium]
MSTYREPTPLDQPFPRGFKILKRELSKSLESFFYTFEHEMQEKTTMSQIMRLHESQLMTRSKEIGGKIYLHMQQLMQASSDYANGHGKIESVYEWLERLRDDLK